MLEFQRPFCVKTPIGYGWVIYVCKESHLANDIWTVAMEQGGSVAHFRSDQIKALPNGTLDIVENAEVAPRKEPPRVRLPKRPEGHLARKAKHEDE
jgi:hypothetical protein